MCRRDGRDLPVYDGGMPACLLEPNALLRQPFGSALIVGQDGQRCVHDVPQKLLQYVSSFTSRKSSDNIPELVPNVRADRALAVVLAKLGENTSIWDLPHCG